ncbi:MAG: DUF4422 domain-containing protein [Lachnospiraceae bacterium]|nr:DUF4422 domain-containing protein [Lachnospiraceae bacterium]
MPLQNILTCPFCIYGAGIVASSAYMAIQTLYNRNPLFFLVSDPKDQDGIKEQIPAEIDGIVVKTLSEWAGEVQGITPELETPQYYLIATPEAHHDAIKATLLSSKTVVIKAEQVILFTSELENRLMEEYYRKAEGCTTALSIIAKDRVYEKNKEGNAVEKADIEAYDPISESKVLSIQVFQAKSHIDKQLCSQSTVASYIYPIQVGAALTDRQLVDLQDNQGDNISAKNRNYCELTATYYAWKHSHAAYKGICHYRRIFDISEQQMQRLLEMKREWDVILPYPSIHYPNISAQHSRYVKEADWNAMLRALEEVAPEYLGAYKKSVAAGEQFFHNFNMLIAKAPVFDDYCDFLFSVLNRTEELTTPKGWERADRFAGYLGENLTTIYFLKNRGKWKIAYVGKVWLI